MCKVNCGNKKPTDQCRFTISYAEGSSLEGMFIEDNMQLEKNSVSEGVNVGFGCTTK